MTAEPRRLIPRFGLYGEASAADDETLLHVETIDRRSRPNGWTIRPHAHPAFHQLLVITAGGGSLSLEGRPCRFDGPALLVAPRGSVHGFAFDPETSGYVATVADSLLRRLDDGRRLTDAVFGGGALVVATPADAGAAALQAVERELATRDFAGRAAADAHFLLFLIGVARTLKASARTATSRPSRRLALAEGFQRLLDRHLRAGWSIGRFAGELGVAPGQLRAACVEILGKPPVRLLQEALMIEAKRALLLTPLSVAEIGYDLGFTDPAYFSRAFAKWLGEPPGRYRKRLSR